MKKAIHFNLFLTPAILLSAGMILVFSCGGLPPENIAGNYLGMQKVTVFFQCDKIPCDSITGSDSVLMNLKIGAKGIVTGNLGNAEFRDCILRSNMRIPGTRTDVMPGYTLSGNIIGPVFPSDTLNTKVFVTFVFVDQQDSSLRGMILQRIKVRTNLMARYHLTKQGYKK
jgi:hypothetical protein